MLTSIARETDTIELGPSVVNVYSRSPALLGQTATTLQEVADGRLRMGIAPSGPAVIEGGTASSSTARFGEPASTSRSCAR